MKNIALMFPGVGSQYSGMGKTFHEAYPVFRDTLAEASEVTGMDIVQLCLSPEADDPLQQLDNSQVALTAVNVAYYRVYMQEVGIAPQYYVGYSLGEIAALCCAGLIQFADALTIVRQRSAIIQEVMADLQGTMAWVINLDTARVEEICHTYQEQGREIFVSAFDTVDQCTISGQQATLMEVARVLEQHGAIVYPLKMSGPFHCPMMQPAAEQMSRLLQSYQFRDPLPGTQVIANHHALPYASGDVIKHLSQQLASPIRWKTSFDYLLQQGVQVAIEMGPKNVLKFLAEKHTNAVKVYPFDNVPDLQELLNNMVIRKDGHLPVLARCLHAAVTSMNYNPDTNAYHNGVVVPFKKMEQLYETLDKDNRYPSATELQASITTVASILDIKQVPPQEKQQKMEYVLQGKTLQFD